MTYPGGLTGETEQRPIRGHVDYGDVPTRAPRGLTHVGDNIAVHVSDGMKFDVLKLLAALECNKRQSRTAVSAVLYTQKKDNSAVLDTRSKFTVSVPHSTAVMFS